MTANLHQLPNLRLASLASLDNALIPPGGVGSPLAATKAGSAVLNSGGFIPERQLNNSSVILWVFTNSTTAADLYIDIVKEIECNDDTYKYDKATDKALW